MGSASAVARGSRLQYQRRLRRRRLPARHNLLCQARQQKQSASREPHLQQQVEVEGRLSDCLSFRSLAKCRAFLFGSKSNRARFGYFDYSGMGGGRDDCSREAPGVHWSRTHPEKANCKIHGGYSDEKVMRVWPPDRASSFRFSLRTESLRWNVEV